MKYILYILVVLISSCTYNSNKKTKDFVIDTTLERDYFDDVIRRRYVPDHWKGGTVNTADEAFQIAKPKLLFITDGDIELQKPFHINLVNDSIWIVHGYPQPTDGSIYMGGGIYMEILKEDGSISKIIIEE